MFDIQFSSLSEFLWMAGHGPYVWACYAISVAGIAGLVWAPIIERKKFLKVQKGILQRAENQD